VKEEVVKVEPEVPAAGEILRRKAREEASYNVWMTSYQQSYPKK
jgi:hypothetical protein